MAPIIFSLMGRSQIEQQSLLDPVQKFRVSQPEALIDTDFEYGTQNTKWESIELVNNIPTLYSRSGDETIALVNVTITSGTSLVQVETLNAHDFVVGAPFIITGLTNFIAEGSFFVQAILSTTKFIYRAKITLTSTGSIYDKFSSYLYPARLYQASQYNIANIASMETTNASPSRIVVTTKTPSGFVEDTNLILVNSTGLKEVEFNASLVDIDDNLTTINNIITTSTNLQLTGFRERNVNPYDWESKKTLFFNPNNVTGNNITVTNHGLTGTENYLMYVPPVGDTSIGGLISYNLYRANIVNTNTISLRLVSPAINAGLYWQRCAGDWNANVNFFLETANALEGSTLATTIAGNDAGLVINQSAEFIGYFRPHVTGNWQFIINSEDNAYFFFGDTALNPIAIPSGVNGTTRTGSNTAYADSVATSAISLVAGSYYPIRIMYGRANVASSNHNVTIKFIFPGQATYVSVVSGQSFYFNLGPTYTIGGTDVVLSAGGTTTFGTHALLKAYPITAVSKAALQNVTVLMNTANFANATMPANNPVAIFSAGQGLTAKGFAFESINAGNARVLLKSTNNITISGYKKCFIKTSVTVGASTTPIDISETVGGSILTTRLARVFNVTWIVPLSVFQEYDSFYYSNHGYSENDIVTYSVVSGSGPVGLGANGTTYKVGVVSPNWFRLKTNVASPVLIDVQSVGNGTIRFQKNYVNPSANTIYAINHNLLDFTQVTYKNNTFTNIGGLTNNSTYWVYSSTPTRFKLSSTNPTSSTTPVNLTSKAVVEEIHSIVASGQGALDDNYKIQTINNTTTFELQSNFKIPYRLISIHPNQNIDLKSSYIYSANHGLNTGSRIIYQANGNTVIGGLTDNTSYYAIRIDLLRFRLALSYEDALTGTYITITGLGTGTNHYFQVTSVMGEINIVGGISITSSSLFVTAISGKGIDFLSYFKQGDSIHFEIPSTTTLNASLIDISNDIITFSAVHSMIAGDALIYTGTTQLGLTQNFIYYVEVAGLTTSQVKLHITYDSAINAGAGKVDLTGTGTPTGFVKLIANTIFSSKITEINSKSVLTVETAPVVTNAACNFISTTLMVPRADGTIAHRSFDGGVEMIPSDNPDAQLIRQTRRYFRYQSGKGIQMSEAVNFAGLFELQDLTRVDTTAFATSRKPHRLSVGNVMIISRAIPSSWNGKYEVTEVTSLYNFQFDLSQKISNSNAPYTYLEVNVPEDTSALGFPAYTVKNWTNCSIRVGMFDDQNGLLFEYDGQTIYCVRRNSTSQIPGNAIVQFNSSAVGGVNTKYLSQLSINERIVIRGQTYKVVSIESDTDMYIQPPYRGINTDVAIISKVFDKKYPQNEWSVDKCDGTGPSGYILDITQAQMIFIDYAWYGAGKVRYGFRTGNGNIVYVHEIIHNNLEFEAYMRSGNLPGRYEIANIGKPSYVPALMHWGTSVIMDGRFDDDKAYLSTAAGSQISYTGATPPTFTGDIPDRNNRYDVWNGFTFVKAYRITSTNNFAIVFNIRNNTQLTGSILQGNTRTVGTPQYVSATSAYVYIDKQPTNTGTAIVFTIVGGSSGSTDYPPSEGTPLISLRLAPCVDNGRQGSLGSREIINRMQLTLDSIGILTTHDVEIKLLLNTFPYSKNWTQVIQPSLSQVLVHSKGDTISGGTQIYNFRVSGGSTDSTGKRTSNNVSVNLDELATLGNSIIGGDGVFPDGPDILTVVGVFVDNLADLTAVKQYSITGRVTWTESQS